jgi:hypothetical protein
LYRKTKKRGKKVIIGVIIFELNKYDEKGNPNTNAKIYSTMIPNIDMEIKNLKTSDTENLNSVLSNFIGIRY